MPNPYHAPKGTPQGGQFTTRQVTTVATAARKAAGLYDHDGWKKLEGHQDEMENWGLSQFRGEKTPQEIRVFSDHVSALFYPNVSNQEAEYSLKSIATQNNLAPPTTFTFQASRDDDNEHDMWLVQGRWD